MNTAPKTALRTFRHRHVWSARNVVEMTERMAEFYTTIHGERQAVIHSNYTLNTTDPNGFTPMLQKHTRQITETLSQAWGSGGLLRVFADQSFADMVQAAASVAPLDPLKDSELLSAEGVVFFRTPQDFSWIVRQYVPADEERCEKSADNDPTYNVRAMAWFDLPDGLTVFTLSDGPTFWQTVLKTHHPDGLAPNPIGALAYPYLGPASFIPGNRYRSPLNAIIRAITAIGRSPQTVSQVSTPLNTKKNRRKKRRAGDPETQVTTVSLRRPEYATLELDAAKNTDSETTRRLRQHWVRGHWREQWYASREQHERIWIDGFIKGDAELGQASSTRVHLAKGDAAA